MKNVPHSTDAVYDAVDLVLVWHEKWNYNKNGKYFGLFKCFSFDRTSKLVHMFDNPKSMAFPL